MAFEPSPTPPAPLSAETLARVRDALAHTLSGNEVTGELHDALCALAREARERGLRAEQMLRSLKEVWGEMPEVRRAADRHQQAALLQRLITLCITEYYGS
jgi:hypothetical protein